LAVIITKAWQFNQWNSSKANQERLMQVKTDIEKKADEMLEAWSRELRDGKQGAYPTTSLDGNLALTETRNHRTKSRPERMAAGKESRSGAKVKIVVSAGTEEIERIMINIRAICPDCYMALKLSYQVVTMRDVQRIMKVSYSSARKSRETGFKMVCAALLVCVA
jgi:hypothetical protein